MTTALRHAVTAAMLTPFDASGAAVVDAVGPYAASLVRDGIGALAVGAHTGRGPHLTEQQLTAVIRATRNAVDVPIIAGIRASEEDTLARRADALANAGADLLMLYPVAPAPDQDIAALHARLARTSGLPVVAFVLYEAASGHRYSADLARRLVATEGVLGLKVAVLDDAVACQDILTGCRAERPDTVLFTGEDRMFGPSLMWGADAALVGIAAALPSVTVEVVRAWTERRYSDFVRAAGLVDALGAVAFAPPVDTYVQRMAWLAAWEQRLPKDLCHDPLSTTTPAQEQRFLADVAELLAQSVSA